MKRLFCVLLALLMLFFTFVPAIAEDKQVSSKLSAEVKDVIKDMSSDEEISVYVLLNDIDSDAVMDSFAKSFKGEASEYMLAKEGDPESSIRQAVQGDISRKGECEERADPVNGDLLQKGIENKRALFAKTYLEQNGAFANAFATKSKQIFVSKYSPLIILTVSKQTLLEMEKDSRVASLELFQDLESVPTMTTANAVSRADYVRDTCGNTGTGVKIGIVESIGLPMLNESDLSNATIIRNGSAVYDLHSTKVARILVGKSYGIAPNAQLYCTIGHNVSDFYSSIEWLISKGVNVINASLGFQQPSRLGQYDDIAQWIDHIAIMHDVHFVVAAGNRGNVVAAGNQGNGDAYVTSPGMAYNAITVGGFNDMNTVSHTDDERYISTKGGSSYRESVSSGRPEKPNIIASAQNIIFDASTTSSGTSYAAPQVTGIIAQLCGYRSALKVKQTAVGAMLAAGASLKLEGVNGSGQRGDSFPSGVRISGSTQISDYEGAGKVNARDARLIASTGNYWGVNISASSFPYTQTVYINASNDSLTRVAIFWLKRNSLAATDHTTGTVAQESIPDLDLKVYAPDGTLVGSSTTTHSKFEIVQFTTPATGTYSIQITKHGTGSTLRENVGIAVW